MNEIGDQVKDLDEDNTKKSNNSSNTGQMPFHIEQISNNLIDSFGNQEMSTNEINVDGEGKQNDENSAQQETSNNENNSEDEEKQNEKISTQQETSNNENNSDGEEKQNEEISTQHETNNNENNSDGEEKQNDELSTQQKTIKNENGSDGEEIQNEEISTQQENNNNENNYDYEEKRNEEISKQQETSNNENNSDGEEKQNDELSTQQENSNNDFNSDGVEKQNEDMNTNFGDDNNSFQKRNETAIQNIEKRYKASKIRNSSHLKNKTTFCKLPPSSKASRSVTRPKTSTMVTYPRSLRPPSLYNQKGMHYRDRETFTEMQKKMFDEMIQDKYYIKSIHSPYKCNLYNLRKQSIKKTKLDLEKRDTHDRRERFISTKNYLKEVKEAISHDEKLVKKDFFPLADKSLRILAV